MLLLDTCAFLWFLYDDPKLPNGIANRIEESEKVYISIASFWEIAIKKSIKKLEISDSITELKRICDEESIFILPIKTEYLERIQKLPAIHNDPFDRLIIATAVEEDLTLLTDDGKIRMYQGVRQLW